MMHFSRVLGVFLVLAGVLCFCYGSEESFIILHTTDIHGWIYGHRHIEGLDADAGDLQSLVEHLREDTMLNGTRLFMFDTGDLIEGTGLSDATSVHGQYIFDIMQSVDYDAWTIGNHDVGHYASVEYMGEHFIPNLHGRYVTSNVEWSDTKKPLGGVDHLVLTTPSGTRILCLGVLYDFDQNANNTIVTKVEDYVTSDGYKEVLTSTSPDVLFFLVHIDPLQSMDEINALLDSARKVLGSIPVLFLSGHGHKEYWSQLDTNAYIIESFCYLQALAVLRFKIKDGVFADMEYEWAPGSVSTFHALCNRTSSDFETQKGFSIKGEITKALNKLHLDDHVGCANATYDPYLNVTQPLSLYHLYIEDMLPALIYPLLPVPGATPFYITNSAFLRAPLYQGDVIRDDVFNICPFKDDLVYFSAINGMEIQKLIETIEPSDYIHVVETNLLGPYLSDIIFYYSQTPLVATKNYVLISAHYDAIAFRGVLTRLFPDKTWIFNMYPTQLSTTDVIETFVKDYMPCPGNVSI